MAAARSKVASTNWLYDENNQISRFREQELEDFTFAARNEVEWLNEHMKDTFSKSQVDVTEIFKTPGKLRGKTPRTARKRDPHSNRQPLTDLFSTNARQAPQLANQDEIPIEPTTVDRPVPQPMPVRPTKTNTDSGYHGLSEDETDADENGDAERKTTEKRFQDQEIDMSERASTADVNNTSPSSERAPTTTEGSFHSARERPMEPRDVIASSEPNAELGDVPKTDAQSAPAPPKSSPARNGTEEMEVMDVDQHDDDLALDEPVDGSHSPSQGSSPFEPLVRKSSLTFAALPAPEPWTSKKSVGARLSRTSQLDQTKHAMSRGSYLGRFTGGRSIGVSKQAEAEVDTEVDYPGEKMDLDETSRPVVVREESDREGKLTRLHNKSSTQRLHDKINELGKQPARPTKSIPASIVPSQPSYPQLPLNTLQTRVPEQVPHSISKSMTAPAFQNDEEDDWIPPTHTNQPKRPLLPKSTTTDVMENIRGKQHIGEQDFEPGLYDDAIFADPPISEKPLHEGPSSNHSLPRSASAAALASPCREEASAVPAQQIHDYPENPARTATPAGTPMSKRNVDGPLSASKFKLQSIMKTARGLFTSSAGVSAQAKIEALASPSAPIRGKLQELDTNDRVATNSTRDEELRPMNDSNAEGTSKPMEGRKTRSSTEKEEKKKEQEVRNRAKGHDGTLTARATESVQEEAPHARPSQAPRPVRQSPRRLQKKIETKQSMEEQGDHISNTNGNALKQSTEPTEIQPPPFQKPKEIRRPVKPPKEAASKPKPQTIHINAPSKQIQRVPPSNAALSSSLQDSLPPTNVSRPGLVKKASNASIQTSISNSSLKSSTSSKPKALIAAERKKEQDEKEAQRKLDQKREIERKRAAQQEEARQQERLQREEADRQRERERAITAEDPKKAASRQLIEKRRLELARKEQQQQRGAPQRPHNDHVMPQERLQAPPPSYRQELGGARPPSRLHTIQDPSRPVLNHPPPNPARPPIKRVLEPEVVEEPSRSVRTQAGSSYQANESKRRRTEEDDTKEPVVRPTMAPPIRQSNIRKELNKLSNYNSYNTAPPAAAHHASTMLKTSTINQSYQHVSQQQGHRPGQPGPDMSKYGTARPPYADAPNPPAAPTHKTPLPKHLAPPPKASPQFVNGENIHLDDIPTDSDSDDSPDPAKRTMLPEWVQSPELRRLIEEQERNQNADSIFGPPQTPRMEEMFKDRHQRFRNRTSSANWTSSGDRLTEEEKVADCEARERLRRAGGWTYDL